MSRSRDRCRETGLACSTSYKEKACRTSDGRRCDRCTAWKQRANAEYQRQLAPKPPKVPAGMVLRSTTWERPDPVPVAALRPVRVPAPAGHTSAGLLASHGFGPKIGGAHKSVKAPGKATARTGQDVRALKWPPNQRPWMRCGSCGTERELVHRAEALICGGCGGELGWAGWVPINTAPPLVINDILPGVPGTTAPTAKRRKSGANNYSDLLGQRSWLLARREARRTSTTR
jgi:hypothetical protein